MDLPLSQDVAIKKDDPLIYSVWNFENNFLIEYSSVDNVPSEQKICAIYFSSNGIWYPDTVNTFYHSIIEKNRFEWYGTRVNKATKHIFVRDVFKQWYAKGINQRLNSVEKVAEWLRGECEGYKTIVIGSSAGGYGAVLFGNLIDADIQIAFSPQLDISEYHKDEDKYPLMVADYKYNFISDYARDSKNLFLFYSIHSKNDFLDIDLAIKARCNVIMFDNTIHGVPFNPVALPTVINMNEIQLASMKGKIISPIWFSIRYMNFQEAINKVRKKLKKILK